jgi:hypothetical protein
LEPEIKPAFPPRISLWPLALLGIPLFAWSYISSRIPRQATSKAEHPQDSPKIKCGDGIIKVDIVSQVPPTPSENENSNGSKECTPLWRKIAEIAIAIGTLGLLLVNIFLASYTSTSARAAKRSVELAGKNARMDQRAWVAVSDIPPDFQKNKDWKVRIIFKNTGKTPAKDFVIKAIGEAVAKGQKPNQEERTLPGRGIIAPDGLFHSNLSVSSGYDWNSTDLIIHGRIDYDSVFGCSHWTEFCYHFIPDENSGGGFAPCDSGNDIDNNPP